MKKLIFSISIISVFIFFALGTSADDKLIPGSEKAEIFRCTDESTVYLYDSYEILQRPSKDFEGNNIFVYSPRPKNTDPCTKNQSKPYYHLKAGEFGGANTFFGLYENLIFIDQWTGRDFKRLLVINLNSKSLVFFDTFAKPSIHNGKLEYFRTLKAKRKSVREKIPCPDAEKWQSEGKQVLYVEKMTVNLSTMKKHPSKKFSCMPTDPIGMTKPKRYGH